MNENIENQEKLLITSLIEKLARLNGTKQKDLAELVGITPTSMSLFMSGHSTTALSAAQVERIFEKFDVNLRPYLKRLDLAEEVARKLSGYEIRDIMTWPRETFIEKSGMPELEVLPDYNKTEFFDAYESGLVDINGCFASFKELVLQYMKIQRLAGEKFTPTKVVEAKKNLFKEAAGFHYENTEKVNAIKKSDERRGAGLGALLGGVAGAALALATCFLLATDDD